MTDAELKLYKQIVEIRYLLSWFNSRSNIADEDCALLVNDYVTPQERAIVARKFGGIICDFEHMTQKLRKEWDKFLKLKKIVKKETKQ